MNELLFKIFNCCIRFFTGGEAIASESRTKEFSIPTGSCHAQWLLGASAAKHPKHTVPQMGCFTGEPFDGCELDYSWHIFRKGELEVLRVEYQNPNPWQIIEAEIAHNNATIRYIAPEGQVPPAIDPYVFPFTNLLFTRILHHQNGVLVHASGINDNGNGYIFTAVSGTGKSTMAGLWAQKGGQVINDDIIAITTHEGIQIHNIPMPHYSDHPKSATLKAIFIIKQSPRNYIMPLKGASAAMLLMANCIQQFGTPEYVRQHLATISAIAAQVPIYEAGFLPDTNIVDLIRHEIG